VQLRDALIPVGEAGLEPVELAFQGVDRGLVEERRPERQPDPDRQEHGGERHDVIAEIDHEVNVVQEVSITSRIGSLRATMMPMVMTAATTMIIRSRTRTVEWYSLLTPLASTSIGPTFIRTRKVDAIPARPLSRNSTMELWVPTATINSQP